MRNFLNRRLLVWVVATVLLAAMVLGATSCTGETKGDEETTTAATVGEAVGTAVGEGQTSFTFEVSHLDGTSKVFTVKTDAKTVGEALVNAGLIAGEDGPYGLYVKTVDGETLDYDTHKKYWAFYENGATAMNGVDKTDVVGGATYAFRAE